MENSTGNAKPDQAFTATVQPSIGDGKIRIGRTGQGKNQNPWTMVVQDGIYQLTGKEVIVQYLPQR
jgi:hypothetical protein